MEFTEKFVEKTVGTVIAVKKLWQIKINTKPVRSHSLDGAVFPHIVTVKYTARGVEYIKKKYVRARLAPPRVGETVDVLFRKEKPSKCKIIFEERKII